MLLKKILESSSSELIDYYIHLENHVNGGSPSGFTTANQVPEQYRPGVCRSFLLPYINLKREQIQAYVDEPAEGISNVVGHTRDKVVFCLFPTVKNELDLPADGHLEVSPTASGRTVVSTHGDPFFIKLHYNGLLGRVDRKMTKKRVRGGQLISSELRRLVNVGKLSSVFSYLPESIGLVSKEWGEETGVCYREFNPYPRLENRRMIPFFSLFSRDGLSPEDPTLLSQMLRRSSNPRQYFSERVISPIIESFRTLVEDGGLWPEDHAQNLLMEIDSNGDTSRIIHRDLYEFYPDVQVRNQMGMGSDGFEKTMDLEKNPVFYHRQKSYLFDFKLGEYILRPLIENACETSGVSKKSLIEETRRIFLDSSDVWKDLFFPYDKTYALPPTEKTYENGEPIFVEMGKPIFR